jgi:hypothetical protein
MFIKPEKRRLNSKIERYKTKLASSETVTPDETVKCHTAILTLSSDTEQKIRSIQTLASLNKLSVIAPTVRELVALGNKWPDDSVTGWPQILLAVLRDLHLDQT